MLFQGKTVRRGEHMMMNDMIDLMICISIIHHTTTTTKSQEFT